LSDAPSYQPWSGSVWTDDPPLDTSGMTLIQLTPLGHLIQFVAVPPQVDKPVSAASPLDWAPLFSAAGLDSSKWTVVRPEWTPPVYGDARAAWTGTLAERPDFPMRIEASAYRGKPVYFELIGPWTRPSRMQQQHETSSERAFLATFIVLLLAMLVGGAMLARRNLRLGRGDRRGAFRLAAFVFVASAVAWLLGAHQVSDLGSELFLFLEFLAWALLWSYFFWVLYVALEPYLRRRWPATLVSWSRLMAGGIRDPLVGRDVLAGCLWGAVAQILTRVEWFVPSWLGHPPPQPLSGPDWQFLGARTIIAGITNSFAPWLFLAFMFLFLLVLFRVLLRKEWAAAIAWILFNSVFFSLGRNFSLLALMENLFLNVVTVFLLRRLGLLWMVVSFVFVGLLTNLPLTTQWSAWYSGYSIAGILLMAAIVLFGFYTSLGGRPIFGGAVLEE
jgi:hypothetical protein